MFVIRERLYAHPVFLHVQKDSNGIQVNLFYLLLCLSIFRRVGKIAKTDCYLRRLSARMQVGGRTFIKFDI
jgi:hypothetical protein